MKITYRTLMRALRLYGLADDNTPMKAIRHLDVHDGESFVRATFVFEKRRYGALYGSVVDETLLDELWPHHPEPLELLPNPLDAATHETPLQGKFFMLMRLPVRAQRLDVYLAAQFDGMKSRSQWQKHIKAGHVSVNGIPVMQSRREVTEADDIAVAFPDAPRAAHHASVLYQDADVVVLYKPAGMLTHAKGGIAHEYTAADAMRNMTTFAADSDRPGIVHRLDRDTSGVLIAARHPEAAAVLQRQFATRRAQKAYLAVVQGRPRHDAARIDLPIGRHPQKPSTFRIDPNGKPAQTDYHVLATSGDQSLVLLQPKTGRTHQLRVHMQHLGTPIVGDRVYGSPADRLLLHAYQLTIALPSGERRTFTAPVPSEFYQLFPDLDTLL